MRHSEQTDVGTEKRVLTTKSTFGLRKSAMLANGFSHTHRDRPSFRTSFSTPRAPGCDVSGWNEYVRTSATNPARNSPYWVARHEK